MYCIVWHRYAFYSKIEDKYHCNNYIYLIFYMIGEVQYYNILVQTTNPRLLQRLNL